MPKRLSKKGWEKKDCINAYLSMKRDEMRKELRERGIPFLSRALIMDLAKLLGKDDYKYYKEKGSAKESKSPRKSSSKSSGKSTPRKSPAKKSPKRRKSKDVDSDSDRDTPRKCAQRKVYQYTGNINVEFLKKVCKECGISGYSSLRKQELFDKLEKLGVVFEESKKGSAKKPTEKVSSVSELRKILTMLSSMKKDVDNLKRKSAKRSSRSDAESSTDSEPSTPKRRTPAKKSPARKVTPKKSPARKTTPKKSPARMVDIYKTIEARAKGKNLGKNLGVLLDSYDEDQLRQIYRHYTHKKADSLNKKVLVIVLPSIIKLHVKCAGDSESAKGGDDVPQIFAVTSDSESSTDSEDDSSDEIASKSEDSQPEVADNESEPEPAVASSSLPSPSQPSPSPQQSAGLSSPVPNVSMSTPTSAELRNAPVLGIVGRGENDMPIVGVIQSQSVPPKHDLEPFLTNFSKILSADVSSGPSPARPSPAKQSESEEESEPEPDDEDESDEEEEAEAESEEEGAKSEEEEADSEEEEADSEKEPESRQETAQRATLSQKIQELGYTIMQEEKLTDEDLKRFVGLFVQITEENFDFNQIQDPLMREILRTVRESQT